MRASRLLAAGSFAVAFALAMPIASHAQGVPGCRGADLMAELATRDPAAHARVLAKLDGEAGPEGRFFKITKGDSEPSWLFGTMHVADPRVLALPGPVVEALDNARTVLTELDEGVLKLDNLDGGAMLAIGRAALAKPGRTLDKVLTKDELDQLGRALKARKQPPNVPRVMKPWFSWVMLALPGCLLRFQEGRTVLDSMIVQRGREAGAVALGLETIEEQLGAFDMDDLATDALVTRALLRLEPRAEDVYETLTQLYLTGRVGIYTTFMTEAGLATQEEAMPAAYRRKLITDRNKVMVERAMEHLENGNTFMAVGALHMGGADGIVALLRKAGFTVERVL